MDSSTSLGNQRIKEYQHLQNSSTDHLESILLQSYSHYLNMSIFLISQSLALYLKFSMLSFISLNLLITVSLGFLMDN